MPGAGPVGQARRYRAFLSYGHDDRALAVAVQRALHRLGRAWYQRPAFTVFRDDSSLGAGALWESLERALADSDHLVLLASPEAARSDWVCREVAWWVEHRDPDDVLVALVRGEIDWDDDSGDLSASTTALPPALKGAFSQEPRWVDLRDTVADGFGDPTFRDRVADLAATLHGCDKSELIGEELRQQRRWTRVRNAAIAVLAVLTLVAGLASWSLLLALRESRVQTATAEAREFAARSERSVNPYEALALAVEAQSRTEEPLPEARLAYARAVQRVTAQPVRPVSALLVSDLTEVGPSVVSPDGTRIATSARRDGWQVRDAGTGAPLASADAEPDRAIGSVAWSPDGRRIATVDDAGRVQVWDPGSGLPVGSPLGGIARQRGDPVLLGTGVEWSPRGDRIASIGLDSLVVWPLGPDASAAPLTIPTGWLDRLAWSPDGARIATLDPDGSIRIWDAATGTRDGAAMAGRSASIEGGIAWSPDGTRLAVVNRSGVQIWRLADRAAPALESAEVQGADLDWSPDGTRLVVVGYEVTVLDSATGTRIGDPVYDHEAQNYLNESRMTTVGWSRDGGRIMTGMLDGSVRFWAPNPDAASPPVPAPSEGAADIAWPPGEPRLIVDEAGTVRTWSLPPAPPALLAAVETDRVLGLSPDGRLLATGGIGGPARVLDTATGAQRAVLAGQPGIRSVVWAPRGPWLAAIGDDGEIWLWDVEQGVPIGPPLTRPQRAKWSAVAWSPDGRRLVTAEKPLDENGALRLWDFSAATPGEVLEANAADTSVAWSPDGRRIATIGDKGSVWIHDLETGSRRRAQLVTAGLFGRLAWHPDSAYLAVSDGNTLSFLDAGTGELVGSLVPTAGRITGFAFSPDGTRLATASDDPSIRMWQALSEPRACEIAREALSPGVLSGLLGPGRPAPLCAATEEAPPAAAPLPVVAAANGGW